MNHVKKYKKVLILLGTACVIYVSFCYILPLVVPFVLALVFAKALQPWTKKIHTATHLNRKLCSVLMVVVSLGALGCFLFYIGYLCTSQLVEFIRHLPGQAGALSLSAKAAVVPSTICLRCQREPVTGGWRRE